MTGVEVGAVSADEREALRASVHDLLARRCDSAAVRATMTRPGRIDRELWQALCSQIGVAALAVPESYEGAGASWVETAAVLTELGAALAPVPGLSTALSTAALLLADDEDARTRLLPGIAAGERLVAVCWAGRNGWAHNDIRSENGSVTGTAHYVIDGEVADTLLVLADDAEGTELYEVPADADGVRITAQPVVDPTRGLATVSLEAAAATRIAVTDDFADRLRTAARALLSAEQVGAARRALAATVEHALSRKQFGREIGSFQAIKHRMADMYAAVETSESMSWAAVDALTRDRSDAADLADAAHVYCSEAFSQVCGDAIQIHGGIAITWEHDIQLYFKRAHGSSQLFGQPHEIVAALART